MTSTSGDSFVQHDLQITHSVRSEADQPVQSEAWCLYLILSWAQWLCVDFLPVTHQKTMGGVGEGATAIVQQGYVNSRLELAFKIANRLPTFLNEMIILSLHSVRAHPFIATIQGLAWDVEDESGDVQPALVFEKAAHGSLESFMRGRVGRSLGLAQRIAFCCQIAIAMADMEKLRLTHNDIKPSNMLVYEECELDGAFVIRVTDFGCAEVVPDTSVGGDYLVKIPESKPWTVPPPEYHHRGFSFSEAVKAMVYSFGVCCLWLLMYNQPGDTGDRFIYELRQTAAPKMKEFADLQLLRHTDWISGALMNDIRQLFELSLAADPATRASSVEIVLPVLQQALLSLQSRVQETRPIIKDKYELYPGVEEDLRNMREAGDCTSITMKFNIPLAMPQLHVIDYRTRKKIFRCIQQCEALYQASEVHARQRQQHCLELAFCYLIGFGVEQDSSKHQGYLAESGAKEELADQIQRLKATQGTLFVAWTAWTRNAATGSHSYDLSYYLGREDLLSLRRIQKQELRDWSEILGDNHFIVMQKYSWVIHIEKTYDVESALELAQKAHRIASLLPAANGDAFTAKTNLADVLIVKKQFKQAHALVKAIMADIPEPLEDSFSYWCDSLLADIYAKRGGRARKSDQRPRALEKAGRLFGERHARKSEKLRRRALEKAGRLFGERHTIYANMLLRLAVFMQGRDAAEAQRLFEQVLDLAKGSWGPYSEIALIARANIRPVLSSTWWYPRRSLPSHQFDREAIESHQAAYGNYHPWTVMAMDTGVSLLLQNFRSLEALELMEHTVRLAAIVYRDNPEQMSYYHKRLRYIRSTCWWFLEFEKIGFKKFLKYQVSIIPIRSSRFGPYHERIWGPLYKVKELPFEPYSYDPHKDPRHVEDIGHL